MTIFQLNMKNIDESIILKSYEIFQLNFNLTRFQLGNSLLLVFCLLGGGAFGFFVVCFFFVQSA